LVKAAISVNYPPIFLATTLTEQVINFSIPALVRQQREFFRSEQTQSLSFRLKQLGKLKQIIIDRQEAILQAAKADLGRPAYEAYFEKLE
jgi:aldehyde dehydrogenase (NAD+)